MAGHQDPLQADCPGCSLGDTAAVHDDGGLLIVLWAPRWAGPEDGRNSIPDLRVRRPPAMDILRQLIRQQWKQSNRQLQPATARVLPTTSYTDRSGRRGPNGPGY